MDWNSILASCCAVDALQSLNSRGYIKTQFAWRHFYFYLTDEGIEYLREYLHLPSEVRLARPT